MTATPDRLRGVLLATLTSVLCGCVPVAGKLAKHRLWSSRRIGEIAGHRGAPQSVRHRWRHGKDHRQRKHHRGQKHPPAQGEAGPSDTIHQIEAGKIGTRGKKGRQGGSQANALDTEKQKRQQDPHRLLLIPSNVV